MLQLYKNIKKKRLELNMSQEELAKKVGYSSRSMIAKIEAGGIDLYQSKIVEIADALGTSAGELMGWEDKNTPSTAAAHFDGDSFTEEELDEIQRYIDYVKSRRK